MWYKDVIQNIFSEAWVTVCCSFFDTSGSFRKRGCLFWELCSCFPECTVEMFTLTNLSCVIIRADRSSQILYLFLFFDLGSKSSRELKHARWGKASSNLRVHAELFVTCWNILSLTCLSEVFSNTANLSVCLPAVCCTLNH